MLKILPFLAITTYALCLGTPSQARETLVFAHLFKETSLQHQTLVEAGRELMEKSGGQIELKIKPDAEIGNQDSRILDAINFGQADMTFVDGPFAARDYAPIGIIAAPYCFRDYAHWQHFKASPLARDLAGHYEKASGLVVLGYYYNGMRHLISRTPIRQLSDMAGIRVRVPNAPIYLQMFRALGATPVPLPFWDTYDALKKRTVDAAEKTLPTLENGKFYEVAPYVSLTGHITDGALVVMTSQRLLRLTSEQQKLVRDVFGKLADRLSDRLHAKEMENLDSLKTEGVTFIPIDRGAFIARLAPMLEGNGFPWSGEIYNQVQKIP